MKTKQNKTGFRNSGFMKWCFKNTWLFLLGIILLVSCSKDEIVTTKNYSSNVENDVSKETVLVIAQNFFKNTNSQNLKRTNNTKTVKSIFEHNTKNNDKAFYVVNYDEGGFIIIAADDRVSPVLAFSDSGSFSSTTKEIIAPVQYWMDGIKDQVRFAIDNNLTQKKEIKLQWEGLATNNTKQIKNTNSTTSKPITPPPTECPDINIVKGPLLTTTWDQWGNGFNDLIPLDCIFNPGGKAPTGCVATAMAQVMRYYQKPNTYNWANMPNTFGSFDTQLLMLDAGTSVNMQYTCDASGTSATVIAPALMNTFGFSNASFASFNYNVVVQNINSNKPVILTGYTNSTSSGHAWVCDGYIQSTVYFLDDYGNCTGQGVQYYPIFYMNWGWHGSYDGYYNISNFNPGSSSYNYDRKMIYNINL
jgi:hypothetical protein